MAVVSAAAYPAKRFFVEMLTRDIELSDAVLDLLDNCVDGAIRSGPKKKKTDKPYEGYFAKISISDKKFTIEDNCGGIEKKLAEQYAFRFGRPAERDKDESDMATVGVYGIGMKRAIFKIGSSSTIFSSHETGAFKVEITPKWISDDKKWTLDLADARKDPANTGTKIEVTNLHPAISVSFSTLKGNFATEFEEVLSRHYGYIMEKGFRVYINDKLINPTKVQTLVDGAAFKTGKGITPYIYKTSHDGVEVQLVMGLYQKLPSDDEKADIESGRRTKENAGWTVICNDRVVLSANKDHQTGWGEAGVPAYHSQFVALAGVVSFTTKDARKLPVTTTKRGIDLGSPLYNSVKEEMRAALKTFTTFTNSWKSQTEERTQIQAAAKPVDAFKIEVDVPDEAWQKVRKGAEGFRYVPKLPVSKEAATHSRIQFVRAKEQIAVVLNYLGEDSIPESDKASNVGAAAFDWVYAEAVRK